MIFGPTSSPGGFFTNAPETDNPEYQFVGKTDYLGEGLVPYLIGKDGNVVSKPDKMVKDSSLDAISQLAKDLNLKLSDDTKDYLWQYYLNEKSNETAWHRSMEASNTQYQRAVADLKAAGLNPFLAISSLSGSAPTASGSTVQGGLINQRQSQKESNKINQQEANQELGLGIFRVLAIIAAAIIYAMA